MKAKVIRYLPFVISGLLILRESIWFFGRISRLDFSYFYSYFYWYGTPYLILDILSLALKGVFVVVLVMLIRSANQNSVVKQKILSAILLLAFILKTFIAYAFPGDYRYAFLAIVAEILTIPIFLSIVTNLIITLTLKSYGGSLIGMQPSDFPPRPTIQQPAFQSQPSLAEEIASLQRLRESGALTAAEFTAAKKRVLGQ